MDRSKYVGVIGAGRCSDSIYQTARDIGFEIGKRGWIMVCGGLGGVMEAACRGASLEGGITVGILPGDSPRTANPYVQIPIVTGMGYARNIAVVKTARAVIAVGGSYGTLSEIAHALQNGISVIGLNTWSLSRNGKQDSSIILVKNPIEAVNKALNISEKK